MRTKTPGRCRYPYSKIPGDVVRTGAAQDGRAGFPNDPVIITVTEDSYMYEVVLPDVESNLCNWSVNVNADGGVQVKGMVIAGEITSTGAPITVNRSSRRIFPQRPFSISFTLPGPADPEYATAELYSNGVLEGVVLKAEVDESFLSAYDSDSSESLDIIV